MIKSDEQWAERHQGDVPLPLSVLKPEVLVNGDDRIETRRFRGMEQPSIRQCLPTQIAGVDHFVGL